MSTGQSSNLDIFISYAHEDLEWAENLASTLKAKNFRYFFDKQSLRAGFNWEKEIKSALKTSRHLVILWSKKTIASPWVNREIAYFDEIKNEEPSRKTIFILLENEPTAYPSYQTINDIADKAGVYNIRSATSRSRFVATGSKEN